MSVPSSSVIEWTLSVCWGWDVCAAVHGEGERADVCMQGPEVSLTWWSSLAAHLVFEAASLTETGGAL